MHGDPMVFFFREITSFTGSLHFVQKQKKLNVRSFNFAAISTQIRPIFSTNAGICDLQLSFCEANFT